jgi:internalin A
MQKLGAGDLVFVILSKKYLKSPYCMYELWEVWRNCKPEGEEFRNRIRVFRLPDAKMMTASERVRCAKYWDRQFKSLDTKLRKDGPALLGQSDFTRYKLMQEFASHVGDMLGLIADTRLPKTLEEFRMYGFGDETSQSRAK